MKIHHDLTNFKAKNPVVTIGTFDGVHLGHRKVISRIRKIASDYQGESVIFTFYPHPRLVTSPHETNLRLLNTLEEKKLLFEQAGIDHLVIYPFTQEFSELSYADFVKNILIGQLNTHCLVVGYDHKFGKNREGGYEYLVECAKKYHFRIEKLDALLLDDSNISSTKIRDALQEGNIGKANRFLGYEFTLRGHVIEGKRIGRLLGFPTANIESDDVHKIIPGYGVYAVKILIENEIHFGMLNIGARPTFNHNADNRSIEVHVFDFGDDIYNQSITISFVEKIREEEKFSSVEDLILQLKKDKDAAQMILANSIIS